MVIKRKVKTTFISVSSASQFEDQLKIVLRNIEKEDGELVDIKYSTVSPSIECTLFTAIVIYKTKEKIVED